MKNKTDTVISLYRIAFTFPACIFQTLEIWMLKHNRVPTNAACNSFPSPEVQCFVDVGTFSRGALEGRLLYRDLLASFVARAINYGFIGQAGG